MVYVFLFLAKRHKSWSGIAERDLMKKRIDLETTQSHHHGIKGLFERLLRRFKNLMHLTTMIPVYTAMTTVFALALTPGVGFFRFMQTLSAESSSWVQNFAIAFGFAGGFILYGFTLVFVVPAVNFLLQTRLKPWRGPYYSAESLKWFLHNGLTYMVRFTFLEFLTPSPVSLLFYQMMGMRIGRGAVINTTWISDPSLIEIGDKTTLGGSVTVVAHYGQGGLLVISPVKIGNNCTIGLKASIMGGVSIGDDAKILPHSVVLPKTHIPPGETWGGVPAVCLQKAKGTDLKAAS